MAGAEERPRERVDDPGATEIGARIVRGSGRDDGAVGQRLSGPVVIRDDHVQAELLRPRHLRRLR